MIQAEGTSGCKGPEVSVIWGVQGTESRVAWFDTVGEGRQGQRSKLGADHSALWTMVMISGGETGPEWEEREAENKPPEPPLFLFLRQRWLFL